MQSYKGVISKFRYPFSFMKFRKYGKNIWLSKRGTFKRPYEVSLGNNIFINEKFYISAWNFHIEDNVMIGPGFTATCDDHIYDKVGYNMFDYAEEKNLEGINIENDVWIGANVTILKGVKVFEGAIIGAGSVVTKDIAPYAISFGNPCSFYKTRFENKEDLLKHLQQIDSKYTLDEIESIWKKKKIL